jgi:hypothetical protein
MRHAMSAEQFLALPEAEQARLARQMDESFEPVAVAHEAPPIDAADEAKVPAVGLKIAEALLGVLADTKNSDDRPAVLKRLDDVLWKNYGEDAVGQAVVAGLANEMTDETDSEELARMASTIDGALRRGKSPQTAREGVAALAKAASLLAGDDDDQAVPTLEKLEAAALESEDLDIRRAAIAALRAQRDDYDDDTDYGVALRRTIANLKDSFQEAVADKNDPGVAVALTLTQSLARSSDEEDEARIVARLTSAVEAYPSAAPQRIALRGFLRAFRKADGDDLAASALAAIEKVALSGSENVKRSARVALKRLSTDSDFSYSGEAGKALDRLSGAAPKVHASVPSAEASTAAAARPLLARGNAPWILGGFVAAAIALWLLF